MHPLPFYLHHKARLVVPTLDHVAPAAGGGAVQDSHSGVSNTDVPAGQRLQAFCCCYPGATSGAALQHLLPWWAHRGREPASVPSPQRMGVFKQYTPNNCAKAEAATLHMVWGCVLVGCPLGISLCSTGQSDQGECGEVQTVKPCETSHASVLHAHFSVPSLAQ